MQLEGTCGVEVLLLGGGWRWTPWLVLWYDSLTFSYCISCSRSLLSELEPWPLIKLLISLIALLANQLKRPRFQSIGVASMEAPSFSALALVQFNCWARCCCFDQFVLQLR